LKRLIDKVERPAALYWPGEHDSLSKYISRKNIENFGELLKTEFDPKMRQMVGRLLEIEKAKWVTAVTPKARQEKIKRKAAVLE
jgi:hypothetical protein